MKPYQQYALKFVGVSLVAVLVVGGPFWWLAAVSTEDGPLMFGFLGGVVSGCLVAVLLFKYVAQMIDARSSGEQAVGD